MTALLADIVAKRADEPAVIDERGTTTWAQLDRRATRLVHALQDRGLRSGDTVVAMVGNQVEMIELTIACAHGGWIMVPLNWHWVPREVAYVLDDAEAAAVIVDARWAEVMTHALVDADTPFLKSRLLVGDDVLPSGFERYEDALRSASTAELIDPQRGGPMFYTSGTTGWPKGVRSSLSAVGGPPEVLLLIAHTMAPIIGVTPGDPTVQLVCGPLYHSAQWAFGLFALCCGATVVLQHRFDASGILELIDEHQVTNVHLVPTQMIRLLELPDEQREAFDGSSLRQIIHGAAPCSPSVKRRMIEWVGPIVTEYYGGTEGGFLALIHAADWLAKPGSVGKPLTIIEILVIGDDGQLLGPNETGDIWFRNLLGSDFEYHKAPEKTSSAHRSGGLGTLGDVGYLDDDGYLFLSDRKIDMIVSGGVNIYPAEIEGVLGDHRAVADAAVFGVPDREMGEAVHAAVVLRHGHVWSEQLQDDLDGFCRDNLAGYKVPRTFEVHGELPRSEAGKLTKRTLRDPWWADQHRQI
ncbi:AMP-binding protein [Aquihabitans sp. McL0605]|uniref:AMP-binding protein n=1 Tax=Aquihabitans sp. McL0605 TaxID=3415671 RepID=UPI003CE89906